MFKGAMVAIVTPFKDGRFDEKAFKELIEFQIKNGTDAIIPCGTTGESATLAYKEHNRVVELCVETVNKRVPVIAGTGSNSTKETIMLTRHAEDAGADGALLITPYYNKPTQEGLYRHYKAVSENVDIPLLLYNVPGRTGLNMLPETTARLAELKNIKGIKDATGNLNHVSTIIELCPKDFSVLSGDDFTTFPVLSIGGSGVISVTSNVYPKGMASLIDTFESGGIEDARRIHYELMPLHRAMFLETNPIPAKTALALMGKVREELRLPLAPMDKKNRESLAETLKKYGLI